MGQKSRWALPNVVHPPKSRKFVICVPDEQFYIAAFQGLLIELTYSKNWQRDSAHTAAVVSRVWQQALQDVLCDDCGEIIRVEESDDFMAICEQLRFQNGKLQGLCCGEWVDISGQGGITIGGPDQPGAPQPQPAPGECQTYHGLLSANSEALVPVTVSDGDTLEFTNLSGAGWDGVTAGLWTCPDGGLFFAGACVGGAITSGSDPDPSLNHMGVIVRIDGAYYPAYGGLFTVPGGVSNAQVYVQVNDDNLSDNAGSYSFDVEVCNAAPTTFEHEFNFLTSDGGWVANNPGPLNNVWALGVGWQDAFDSGSGFKGVQIRIDHTSAVLTSVELHYTMSAKDASAIADCAVLLPSTVVMYSFPGQNGNIVVSGGTNTTSTRLLNSAWSSTGAGNIGSSVVTKIVVRGIGADPF